MSRSAGLGTAIIWLRHRRIARSPGEVRVCVGLMAERLGRRAHRDRQVSPRLVGCHPNLSPSWSIKHRGLGKTTSDRPQPIDCGSPPGNTRVGVIILLQLRQADTLAVA